MPNFVNDPIGRAISDYVLLEHEENIIVKSSICDDDVIPVAYLFRGQKGNPTDFSALEKIALQLCKGEILEVGAGAGIHGEFLMNQGHHIRVIDTSAGAVAYHQKLGLDSRQLDFYSLKNERYDTLLSLMNGLGIAGSLANLPNFLQQCYDLLNDSGQVLCDSTDIKYLYEDEEGGFWMDLNSAYYGDFDFQMCYKDTCTDTFDWLYVDLNSLTEIAQRIGFSVELLYEHESQYLVKLLKNK